MVFYLRVTPGAKKQRWVLDAAGQLKCYVNAPAVDGKANDAVVAFICQSLNLNKSSVTILAGHTARIKKVEINGIATLAELHQRLGVNSDEQQKIFKNS